MANRDPAGNDNASSVIRSMHSRFVITSASSRTSATGSRIDPIADANNATTAMALPGWARVRSTAGVSGSTLSTAVAR